MKEIGINNQVLELKRNISLLDRLKDDKRLNTIMNDYFAFEGYEITFDEDLKDIPIFASKIILEDDNFIHNNRTIRIKYGLFTDKSGYCHKVKINKCIELASI